MLPGAKWRDQSDSRLMSNVSTSVLIHPACLCNFEPTIKSMAVRVTGMVAAIVPPLVGLRARHFND